MKFELLSKLVHTYLKRQNMYSIDSADKFSKDCEFVVCLVENPSTFQNHKKHVPRGASSTFFRRQRHSPQVQLASYQMRAVVQ